MNIITEAHILRHFPARAALIAAALAISACLLGCDREDKKPAGPPEQVTIACVQSYFGGLIHIAKANNYFRDEGIEVSTQLHQTGVSALDALLDGKADLASTAETPVMFAITGGRPLTMLADTFVSDRELAIVARKDHGVAAPSDLKGKKIAVSPGTIGEFFLQTFLSDNGISPKQVVIVKLSTTELVDAMLAGKVDAASSWNPPISTLQKELGYRAVTFPIDPPHSLIAVLSCRPELPSQKPGVVKGVLRALIRAEKFAKENPGEAIKIVAAAIGMEPDRLSELWRAEDFRVSLDQSLLLSLEFESRWAIKAGLAKTTKVPNYLDFIYFDGLKAVKPEAVRILR